MSQAKVDKYKEEKRNRAKLIKKAKREWLALKAGMSLVAIVLVAWVGVSIYQNFNTTGTSLEDKPTYTVNTTALDEFMTDLNLEEE